MSLVEIALKKLQDSRGGVAPGHSQDPVPARPAMPEHVPTRSLPSQGTAPEMLDAVPLPTLGRTVSIDRAALRAASLLPPTGVERLIADQYQQVKRQLVTSALGQAEDQASNNHLIMMTSAIPGEGKTFTSVNLALSMALEKDSDLLLVDADVAKPHISRIFGVQDEPGLLDLLSDGSLRPESLILPTSVPGLSILPAGRQRSDATELLASERMIELGSQLGATRSRRIVLFDSPPLLLSTEARALVAAVGQVVLVVRAGSTSHAAVQDAIAAIGEGKSVGLILNQSDAAPSTGYFGYGTYGDSPQAPTTSGAEADRFQQTAATR